jgi:hypothetical protein
MFILKKTCSSCPEQYDVFKDGEMVAYLRLRHGHFSASCPDCGGSVVYTAAPDGDGSFDDDEREFFLSKACEAIRDFIIHGDKSVRTFEPGLYEIQ